MPVRFRLVISLYLGLGLSVLAQVNPSGALPKCPQKVIDKLQNQSPPVVPRGQFPGGPGAQQPRESWLQMLSKSESGGNATRNAIRCNKISDCPSGEVCIRVNCDAIKQLINLQICESCSVKDIDDLDEAHGFYFDGCGSGSKLPRCPQSYIDYIKNNPPQGSGGPSGQRPRETWLAKLVTSESGGDAGGKKAPPKPCKKLSDCASDEGCAKIDCDAEVQEVHGQACGLCSKREADETEAHGVTIDGCGSGNLSVFHVVVLLAFVAMTRFPVLFQSRQN